MLKRIYYDLCKTLRRQHKAFPFRLTIYSLPSMFKFSCIRVNCLLVRVQTGLLITHLETMPCIFSTHPCLCKRWLQLIDFITLSCMFYTLISYIQGGPIKTRYFVFCLKSIVFNIFSKFLYVYIIVECQEILLCKFQVCIT